MSLEHEILVRTRDGNGRMLDTAISWHELHDTAIGAERLIEVVAEQNEKKFLEQAKKPSSGTPAWLDRALNEGDGAYKP